MLTAVSMTIFTILPSCSRLAVGWSTDSCIHNLSAGWKPFFPSQRSCFWAEVSVGWPSESLWKSSVLWEFESHYRCLASLFSFKLIGLVVALWSFSSICINKRVGMWFIISPFLSYITFGRKRTAEYMENHGIKEMLQHYFWSQPQGNILLYIPTSLRTCRLKKAHVLFW